MATLELNFEEVTETSEELSIKTAPPLNALFELNEESLELMTIDLLKEQGYSYESGESIGRDYSEVILEYNLTCALFKP